MATVVAVAQFPDRWTDAQIRYAFAQSHQGASTDELLVDEKLYRSFMSALALGATDHGSQAAAASDLLRLRKTGKLDVPTTRRSSHRELAEPMVAELAIRTVLDRHRCSIDDVLCDPSLRVELQTEADSLQPGVDAAAIRQQVLRLRKIRQLRPELVLRVADWDREVLTMPLDSIDLDRLPKNPGIYLFRDSTGYLYIGEAENLQNRLRQHLDGTHNAELAVRLKQPIEGLILELHVFANDSPARQVVMRRAYESELIRSREPKFNLRP